MLKSESIKEIATALSKFQADAINPQKTKQGYNYVYADLTDVLDVIRPIMAKNGLAIVQTPYTGVNEGHIGVDTMLTHSSGEWISHNVSVPVDTAAKMSVAQSAGSTITYLRRYALLAILGLAADDDDAASQVQKQAMAEKATDHQKNKRLFKSKDERLEVILALKTEINNQDAESLACIYRKLTEEQQMDIWGMFGSNSQKFIRQALEEVKQ